MSEELTDKTALRHLKPRPRMDDAGVNPVDTTDDPGPDVGAVTFERETVIDELRGMRAGHLIDQTLGLGLDDSAIDRPRPRFGDDAVVTTQSIDSSAQITTDDFLGTASDAQVGMQLDAQLGMQTPGMQTPVAEEFDTTQAFAQQQTDTLSVALDASLDTQDAFDSAFDSAFAPLDQQTPDAQPGFPSVDDGF